MRTRKTSTRLLRWLLGIVFGIYLGVVVFLMLFERQLIYPASGASVGDWDPPIAHDDVNITSRDGTKLHAWYLSAERARGSLLHLHGNGGNIAFRWPMYEMLRTKLRLNVLALDYRGYGKSEGEPSEKGVIEDAESARAWLAERVNIDPAQVILLGESLGGGVAVDLASRLGTRALILERTFTSLPDVAAVHFPIIPVRLLMRERFDSVNKIGQYHGPLFQVHGRNDSIIPFSLGKRLFDSANEPKRFLEIEDLDHNDMLPNAYYDSLDRFLIEQGMD